jgi:hypothetical protein
MQPAQFLPLAAIVVHLLAALPGEPAGRTPREPIGYYEGIAKSKQLGELAAALNLRSLQPRCEGELETPVGDLALQEGSFDAGRLKLRFDADGNAGTLDARLADGELRGTFQHGGDSGTIALRRVGDARPALPPTAGELKLTSEQWREDLRYFARELPKRHGNAFHHQSRERFEAAVAELERRLDRLGGDEIYVGLDQIATQVGDAHTYVDFPPDRAALPLTLERFGNDYRVVRVARGLEKALGTRVVQIHDTPIRRVRETLLSMTPAAETPDLAQARVTYFLSLGMLLHGFGIVPDRTDARWTFADDAGQEFAIDVRALRPSEKPDWVSVCKDLPVYRQRPDESFWYTYLPGSRSVYCNFRGYQGLDKHARGLLAFIAKHRPEKLIIDLRQNSGGDYTEGLRFLIDPLRDLPAVNARGRLFVLIGVHTFSAAMSNSAQFRARTAATLVGQTIGERPNSYQEVRQMKLPNSRLVVRYSTRFYKFVETGENIIRPDREIIPTWAEYRAGRDPVLEWVLTQDTR